MLHSMLKSLTKEQIQITAVVKILRISVLHSNFVTKKLIAVLEGVMKVHYIHTHLIETVSTEHESKLLDWTSKLIVQRIGRCGQNPSENNRNH